MILLLISGVHSFLLLRWYKLVEGFFYTFDIEVSDSFHSLLVFYVSERLEYSSDIDCVDRRRRSLLLVTFIERLSLLKGNVSMNSMDNKLLKHFEQLFVKLGDAFFEILFLLSESLLEEVLVSFEHFWIDFAWELTELLR